MKRARVVQFAFTIVTVSVCALLACFTPGCGRDRDEPEFSLEPVADEHAGAIVLLDPAGRLLDIGGRPTLFVIHDGKVAPLPVFHAGASHWSQPPPADGAELLVLVAGCRPARVQVKAGRNVVRLEAGFPVRIRMRGARPALAAPGDTIGLGLERYIEEAAGVRLPSATNLMTLAADAFDEDMPTHPQYMRLPPDGILDVLVPEAGHYRLSFDVRWRRGNSSGAGRVGHPDGPFELRPGMDPLVLDWPVADIVRIVKDLERRR